MTMSMAAKAAWPLLWTECDDHGIFEWKPIVLKARIFPADNLDFAAILAEYVELGCVVRVECEGKPYGLIRNFGKFQKPKNASYKHPWREEYGRFTGLSSRDYGSPTPALPHEGVKTTEKPSLMEEGVGVGIGVGKEKAADAALAPARGKSTLEAECRQLVGEEPVLLALDFYEIEKLVESGDVTAADVKAGIRAALAAPNFRIRHWRQLAGWARGAAKERLAGKPKAGVPIVVAMRPEEREAALAQSGKRWVEYDTDEWARVADIWKAEKGRYPPHPQGGWYFPESYFNTRTDSA